MTIKEKRKARKARTRKPMPTRRKRQPPVFSYLPYGGKKETERRKGQMEKGRKHDGEEGRGDAYQAGVSALEREAAGV